LDRLLSETTSLGSLSYQHDPLGRRSEKRVVRWHDEDGDHEPDEDEERPPRVTRYLYDQEDILATFTDTGRELARYTHGPGIDEPLAEVRRHRTRFYHADTLGSIIALSNKHGHPVRSYRYSAFGLPEDHRGDPQPYRFTGREWDKEIGLYYYRARYYGPDTGRFLREDPVKGFLRYPSTLNLYPYVTSNPLRFVDPLGLQGSRGGIPMPWPFRDPYADMTPSQRAEFDRFLERVERGFEKTVEQVREGWAELGKWATQMVEITSGKGLPGPVILAPEIPLRQLLKELGIIPADVEAAEKLRGSACPSSKGGFGREQ
jgi:RHS repeat-associated protein